MNSTTAFIIHGKCPRPRYLWICNQCFLPVDWVSRADGDLCSVELCQLCWLVGMEYARRKPNVSLTYV